jgi:hypothetical protein
MDRKKSRKMGRKSAKAGMGAKRFESGRMFSDRDFPISYETFREGLDYKNRYKDRIEPKNYQSGGSVMNDMDAIDMAVAKILSEGGKTISDADRSRARNRMRGVTPPRARPSGMPRSAPRSYMEDYTAPITQMKDGGEVGGSCRGGGAAVGGTKFRGVK